MLIDSQDEVFSLRGQCGLLGLNRSSLYYRPLGESEENLGLMRLLDEQYTRTPFYGVLRMAAHLRSLGHEVNPKRVRRLLRTLGLAAAYQKPHTSQPNPDHKVYPYLLRGLSIDRCDQAWSTDITYVRLASRLCLPDGRDRLVQPLCAGLGAEHHAGCGFLHRGGGQDPGGSVV